MKEEKILIGQSDGFIVRLSMYEKIRRINNSTMPTLFALGLSADVETVADIAAGLVYNSCLSHCFTFFWIWSEIVGSCGNYIFNVFENTTLLSTAIATIYLPPGYI